MKRLLTTAFLLIMTLCHMALKAQTHKLNSVLDDLKCKSLEMFYAELPKYQLSTLDFSEEHVSYELLRNIINRDVFAAFDLDKKYDSAAKRNAFTQTKDYQLYRKGVEELRGNILKQNFVFAPTFDIEQELRDKQIRFSMVEPNPFYLRLETTDACLKNEAKSDDRRFNVFTSPTLSTSIVNRLKACGKVNAHMIVRLKEGGKKIIITPQKLIFSSDSDESIIYDYTFQESSSSYEVTSVDNTIYDNLSADEQPQYPGGDAAILQIIAQKLKYPVSAMERGVQGRVVVDIVVEKDGSISEAKVVRSVDSDLDKEALRVVKSLSKFTPGTKNGHPVRARYTLPITFRMN